MRRVQGLWKRGEIWQYRVKLPKHIQNILGRQDINRSLRTRSYREAIKRCRSTAYHIDAYIKSVENLTNNHPAYNAPIHIPATFDERMQSLSLEVSASKTVTPTVTPTVTLSVSSTITLRQLFQQYMSDPKTKRSPKTVMSYENAIGVLIGIIGEDVTVADIDRFKCRQVQSVLLSLPTNASKRFPDMTYRDIVAMASEKRLTTLSARSVNKYMGLLSTLLRWAVNEGVIETNPSLGLTVADTVRKRDKRHPFSQHQLQRIFTAPLYAGCKDDGRSYYVPGDQRPRRARFWVPLIGLYSGMRLNEICQLGVGDCRQIEEVWCFVVTEDANTDVDKHLKTMNSERLVPVHPMLIRLGWIAYVRKAQQKKFKRMFPDIEPASTGYLSDTFSKFFSRFLKKSSAHAPKTSFHSFRHNFRDALRECDVRHEVGLALGGWASDGDRGSEAHNAYGGGYLVHALYDEISKIEYQGLDLIHLVVDRG